MVPASEGTKWMVEFGPFEDVEDLFGYSKPEDGTSLFGHWYELNLWAPESGQFVFDPENAGDVYVSIFAESKFGRGQEPMEFVLPWMPHEVVPPQSVRLRYRVPGCPSNDDAIVITVHHPWTNPEADRDIDLYSVSPGQLPEFVEHLEVANAMVDDLLSIEGDELAGTLDALWIGAFEDENFGENWWLWSSKIDSELRRRNRGFEEQHLWERWQARDVICKMRPGSDERVLAEQLLTDWVGSAFGLFMTVGATLGTDMRQALVYSHAPIWIQNSSEYPNVDRWTGVTLTE